MGLFERASEDIKDAMKAKNKATLETLRNVKKFFLEAKTAPGVSDTLTDVDALEIVQKLVRQGKDTAEICIGQGHQDLADVELAQVQVMEIYLPKQMTAEEPETALREIIAEAGATSSKDMGKAMRITSKRLAGLAEGRTTSTKVKELSGQSQRINPAHRRSCTIATPSFTRSLPPDTHQNYIRGQIVYRYGLPKPNEVYKNGQEALIK